MSLGAVAELSGGVLAPALDLPRLVDDLAVPPAGRTPIARARALTTLRQPLHQTQLRPFGCEGDRRASRTHIEPYERIERGNLVVALPVIQILGVQLAGTGRIGGLHDERIPKRQLIALFELDGLAD